MSAATPQEGILILLKISIALRFEPYRRSGKLGLYHTPNPSGGPGDTEKQPSA